VVKRTGRPGLLGTVARSAVIAGTATMTTEAVKRAESRQQAERQADVDQHAAQATGPLNEQTAKPTIDNLVDKLARLAQLRDSGALSGAEFEAAKAKLLG
jgi:hypothetical protein